MKKYGLFVDGSNLFASAKSIGFRVDYTKLLAYYGELGEVTRAFYFTALPPKDVETPLRRMVDFVRFNGWKVIEKETSQYTDLATGEVKLKGNMDVEIAVYADEVAHTMTHMVLFSGDADFSCLIESMQRRYSIHCSVVSSRSLAAMKMRSIANEFVDLASMRDQWVHVPKVSDLTPKRKFSFTS